MIVKSKYNLYIITKITNYNKGKMQCEYLDNYLEIYNLGSIDFWTGILKVQTITDGILK